METAYLVTHGEYSDYQVIAVFTTKEKADTFAGRFGYNVEEHRLDPTIPPELKDLHPYNVWMTKEGKTLTIERGDEIQLLSNKTECKFGISNDGVSRWIVYTVARNAEHAVKVANEKRTAFLANYADRWGDVKFLRSLQERVDRELGLQASTGAGLSCGRITPSAPPTPTQDST